MAEDYRATCVIENLTGSAAKDQLPQAAVCKGALDDQIGTEGRGFINDHLSDGCTGTVPAI